jgi:hypothetical protein
MANGAVTTNAMRVKSNANLFILGFPVQEEI